MTSVIAHFCSSIHLECLSSSSLLQDEYSGRFAAMGDARLFATRAPIEDSDQVDYQLHRALLGDTARLVRLQLPDAKSLEYKSCGVSISLPPIFADPPKWSSHGPYVALVDGPDYTIRVIENAVERRRIRRPIQPVAATSEQATLELGEGEKWVIGRRECTVPPAEVIEQRGIAGQVPVIDRITVTPDRSLWVQRKVIGGAAGLVDVFDADGEYTGTLPSTTPWPADFGSQGRILTLEEDEMGVQRVVVYRVVKH